MRAVAKITSEREVALLRVEERRMPMIGVLTLAEAEELLHELHSAVQTLRGVRKQTFRQRVVTRLLK